MWWQQQNQGGSGSWGSDGQGMVTGVVAVVVGVMIVEVAVAEEAMVGVAIRLLQQWAVVLAVWCASRMAYMWVREMEMTAVIWLPLSC